MSAATSLFPSAYAVARAGFLDEASAAGATVESHMHPERGPAGEELALDVARFGDADARRILIVGSGTHGVEGRAGSGIQRRLIADGAITRPPPGTAVVLVHAINPYGFAHTRRVDHQNVDVNRNFVNHSAAYPVNEAYEGLREVLNPNEPVLDLDDTAWVGAVDAYGRERGPIALFQAVMGGQYEHPDALQFGGTAPAWSNRTLHEVWARHAAGADVAVNIDLHTGLGACGVGTLMQTADADEEPAQRAGSWWDAVMRSDRPRDGDFITCGVLGPGFDDALAERARTLAVVLEFGTVAPTTVMGALRADNWLRHHSTVDSPMGAEVAERMRAAFFVDHPVWTDQVLDGAQDVIGRALAGLAEE